MMKKIVSLILTVALLATMLTVFAVPASALLKVADSNNVGKWAYFSDPGSLSKYYQYYWFIIGTNGHDYYVVAQYEVSTDGVREKIERQIGVLRFSYLMPTDSIPQVVLDRAAKDYPELFPDASTPTEDGEGSTLSEGNLTIIVGIAAAVVFGLGGFLVGKAAGKKKKPALASGENKGEE